MKCARLLLFLTLFPLPAAFAATSYCSGTGCDPSNGVYLAPYAANFLPGGTYGTTTTDNVLFHINWSGFPTGFNHWRYVFRGSVVGSLQGISDGCNISALADYSGPSCGLVNWSYVQPGDLVCVTVQDDNSGFGEAWRAFMASGGPLPDGSHSGFAVCWRYAQSAPPAPKSIVVLVHGWCSDPSTFGNLGSLLSSDASLVMAAPFNYSELTQLPISGAYGPPIEQLANLLANHVRNQLALHPGATQVDIVAHSMGGLITRSWMSGLTATPTAYNGEIRKLVLLGTPNYGASLARLGLLWYRIQTLLALLGQSSTCSLTQASEMQLASPFLLNLDSQWNSFEATSPNAIPQQNMLFIAGTRDSVPPPLGYECGDGIGCDDGLVDISSATLASGPSTRYVPYKHAAAINLPTGGDLIQAPQTTQHKSYMLIKSFLSSGTVLDQCCGATTVDYQPPHLRGVPGSQTALLVLQLENANGQHLNSVIAPSFTFSPKLPAPAQLWWNPVSGAATFLGMPAGTYDITARLGLRAGSTHVVVTTAEPSLPPPFMLR